MKKSFDADISIPALEFMSAATLGKEDQPAKKKKPAAKPSGAADREQARPANEIKSRRVQLVLTPSLYDAMRDYCEGADMSINRYICRLIKENLQANGKL